MKQAAFVVLGLVVSVVVYMLPGFYILDKFLHMGGCEGMLPAFIIILPISLLVGSMVTGFLSRPLLNTKWGLLWIAPGLYLAILTLSFFPLSLYWYLVSLVGVWLGYFLRGLIGHLRKSD